MGRQVFISHADADKETANAVCAALEKNGMSCWVAPRNIPAGSKYGSAIENAIEGCSVVLLLLSAHSAASNWVYIELELAVKQKKQILPVRIGAVPKKNDLNIFISSVQLLDATEGSPDRHFPKVCEGVATLLGIALPPPVPVPPPSNPEPPVLAEPPRRITVWVRREKAWKDNANGYRILLDGEVVGTVKQAAKVGVETTPGPHTLELRLDRFVSPWFKSQVLAFTAGPSAEVRFVCAPGPLLGVGSSYITLTQEA